MNIDPVIVDLGLGNVGSLENALGFLGLGVRLSDDPDDIREATHLILPGVGAFDHAVCEMDRRGLRQELYNLANVEKVPIIGICLGMQLLFESSEEGTEQGLGLIPGKLERIKSGPGDAVKVPHAGFSKVRLEQTSGFFNEMGDFQSFYFTHSYAIRGSHLNFESAICDYGFPFAAAFRKGNIYGTQFHPEKSQSAGLRCLVNFFESSISKQ